VDLTESKSSSLRWAIEELSKQKDELKSKLKIAHKREETNSLINEVNAQKAALENRILSLEEGLKASSELVDDPVMNLSEELDKVNDKLEIAKDRLNTLEQEEYLEELGKKLNGDFASDSSNQTEESTTLSIEPINLIDDSQTLTESNKPKKIESTADSLQPLSPPTTVLMKSPTNRIETEEKTESKIETTVPEIDVTDKVTKLEHCSPGTAQGLEECAKSLGMEPDFLLNKSMQAILRMIARNGNKVSFPLEVEQIEKS
jgi:DNA repair exonuclease SbcCD ATPase subunit